MTNEFTNVLSVHIFSRVCEEYDDIENEAKAEVVVNELSKRIYSNSCKDSVLKSLVDMGANQNIIDLIISESMGKIGYIDLDMLIRMLITDEEVSEIVKKVF